VWEAMVLCDRKDALIVCVDCSQVTVKTTKTAAEVVRKGVAKV